MIYRLITTKLAQEGLEKHKKSGQKKLVEKLLVLLEELKAHPRTGTGKPEQLKHKSAEIWSRHIGAKHRLVYEIRDEELIIIAISAYGHY